MDFHPQVDVLKLIDVTDTDSIGGLHSKIIKKHLYTVLHFSENSVPKLHPEARAMG